MLVEAQFDGLLAVEIDFPHPEYQGDEDAALARSVQELQHLLAEGRRPDRPAASNPSSRS
jgi:hypothetical protein